MLLIIELMVLEYQCENKSSLRGSFMYEIDIILTRVSSLPV